MINATTRLMFQLEVKAVNLCENKFEKPKKTKMHQHSSTQAPRHAYITYLTMTDYLLQKLRESSLKAVIFIMTDSRLNPTILKVQNHRYLLC